MALVFFKIMAPKTMKLKLKIKKSHFCLNFLDNFNYLELSELNMVFTMFKMT